jgi:hypothetical protein
MGRDFTALQQFSGDRDREPASPVDRARLRWRRGAAGNNL